MTTGSTEVAARRRRPDVSQQEAAPTLGGRTVAIVRRAAPIVLALAIVVVLAAIYVPSFFSGQNLANIARQASQTGVVSIGMTFVIITAGIDLSVGAMLAASSVLAGVLLQDHHSALMTVVVTLIGGAILGSLNAFTVANLKLQPFVATLASSAVIGGLALQVTQGTQIQLNLDPGGLLGFLGSGSVIGIPGPVIIFLGTALLGGAVLRFTTFGRYVYAIGGGQEAARLSGIKIKPVLYGVYAIAGVAAAVAGLMYTAQLNVGDPTAGNLIALDSIAAVVIGGTSLFGGSGRLIGTVFGALLLATLANVLDLVGVSSFLQEIVKGIVIVVAVLATGLFSPAGRAQLKKQLSNLLGRKNVSHA